MSSATANLAMEPRPYQLELLQKAIDENSIIFLGTGSGKTFIAAMMIREFGHQLRGPGVQKRTIFLVNSVALVAQQSEFLKTNTGFTCASYCGADNVDDWKQAKWNEEIGKHQILVLVHQVFLDLLKHGFFNFDRVNLLIIDEVHHTAKNHPYNQIMMRYFDYKKLVLEKNPSTKLPRVLGLSASIVTEKCDRHKFLKLKEQLEKSTDCRVITTEENLADMLKHVTAPKESFLTYHRSSKSSDAIIYLIENGCAQIEKVLKETKEARHRQGLDGIPLKQQWEKDEKKAKFVIKLLQNLKDAIVSLGIYAMEQLVSLYKEDLLPEKIDSADDKFVQKIFELANKVAGDIWNEANMMYAAANLSDEYEKLARFSSEKVLQLLQLLEETGEHCRPSTPDFCNMVSFDSYDLTSLKQSHAPNMTAVVFVKMRQTSAVLCHILTTVARLRPTLGFLRVGHAMGGQMKMQFQRGMTPETLKIVDEDRKKLEATLTKFRSGELNCIVSTSVLEEGMDIKKCNLVIRFDNIPELRSYVQSKGRARAKPSKFIMMVDSEEQAKVRKEINEYRAIEDQAVEMCHGIQKDEDDDEPMDDIETYLADPSHPLTSARVDSLSAVSTVNQYVQKLPSDKFTQLLPYFEYEKPPVSPQVALFRGLGLPTIDADEVRCILHLPCQSPIIEPIAGPARATKVLAKRAVALMACRMLHEKGELDEHLKPRKGLPECEEDDDDDEESDEPGEGTKKRKNYYAKQIPLEMNSLELTAASQNILYKIHLVLIGAISEENNVKQNNLYFPQDYPRKLGILLGVELPEEALRPFYLYMYSGRVLVQLQRVGCVETFGEKGRNLILNFHELVFDDVLQLIPQWMSLDRTHQNKELLVVPVLESKIDMAFLQKIERNEPIEAFVFDKVRYEDAVVIHRDTQRCFVQEVLHFMTPLSTMPMTKKTFRSHYQGLMKNLEQPLLRVSSADKKYDDMYSEVAMGGGAKKTQPKTQEEFLGTRMILIPELVQVHRIPASLWQECQLLPFVLNRVSKLIHVGKFRKNFIEAEGLPEESGTHKELLKDYPLEFPLKSNVFDRLLKKTQKSFEKLLKLPDDNAMPLPPTVEELVRPLTSAGAGEIFDLEREEILGDSFLKYSTSIYLFFEKDDVLNEGSLTTLRSRLVGNKNLLRRAKDKNLQAAFTPSKFVPRKNWRPPRFHQPDILESILCQRDLEYRIRTRSSRSLFDLTTVDDALSLVAGQAEAEVMKAILARFESVKDGKSKATGMEPRDNVMIADKSLADAVEALIGCHLLQTGQYGALLFMKYMGINVFPSGDKVEEKGSRRKKRKSISGVWFSPPANAYHRSIDLGQVDARQEILLKKIDVATVEKKLGYHFVEKSFLIQALTHCSYMQNKITNSMERLEFLGDAVVDYLVTCYLFTKFDGLTPGQVTDLRSALVNNNTFAKLAIDSKLHTQLLHHSPKVMAKIDEYATYMSGEESTAAAAGHIASKTLVLENLELHNEMSCPVLEDIEVPKVLGDLIEALLGAVYIDSGFDLPTVWRSFRRLFPEMDDVIESKPTNHVKQLMERFPERVEFVKKPKKSPSRGSVMLVKVTVTNGKPPLHFAGIGNNNKRAKIAAATCAIRELKKRHMY